MRKDMNFSWISVVCLLTLWLLTILNTHYMKNTSYYILENQLYIELADLLPQYSCFLCVCEIILILKTLFQMKFIIQHHLIIHDQRFDENKKFLREQVKSTSYPIWIGYSELNKNALTLYKQQILFTLTIEKC